MRRSQRGVLVVCGCAALALGATNLMAAAQRPAGRTGIHACPLVTVAQLEKILGGKDPLDDRPPHEDELPGGGAYDCDFSTVNFQVDPFDWATLEADAKKHPADFKPLAGVGDAAYLTVNTSDEFVGLYARAGTHTVTIRIETGRPPTATVAQARTAAIALAQALFAKLR